jgi:hypothetical protein
MPLTTTTRPGDNKTTLPPKNPEPTLAGQTEEHGIAL